MLLIAAHGNSSVTGMGLLEETPTLTRPGIDTELVRKEFQIAHSTAT